MNRPCTSTSYWLTLRISMLPSARLWRSQWRKPTLKPPKKNVIEMPLKELTNNIRRPMMLISLMLMTSWLKTLKLSSQCWLHTVSSPTISRVWTLSRDKILWTNVKCNLRKLTCSKNRSKRRTVSSPCRQSNWEGSKSLLIVNTRDNLDKLPMVPEPHKNSREMSSSHEQPIFTTRRLLPFSQNELSQSVGNTI